MADGYAIPLVGSFTGPAHIHTPAFLDGRSLHPLQRTGELPHSGWPNMGAGGVPGFGHGPAAGPPNLFIPPVWNGGILSALSLGDVSSSSRGVHSV